MAHELETMVSANNITPWHGLGRVVDRIKTSAEAIKLAGLDWQVKEKKLYFEEDGEMGDLTAVITHKALIRSTDSKVLGVVGKDFTAFQNDKAFEFFDPFVDDGLASFETAGSLRGGKTVWIQALLNKAPIEVGKGDEVKKYLLLSNAHDGKMAVRVGFTPQRVVCNNTLTMAMDSDASSLMHVHHRRTVATDVEKLREIVNAADAKFEATAEQYRYLARSTNINQAKLEEYVNVVFRKAVPKEEDRRAAFTEKMTETIQRLFETGAGADLSSANGTYWGLYNAATNYLSHEVGKNTDSRLNSLWFGRGKTLNDMAFKTAMEMA